MGSRLFNGALHPPHFRQINTIEILQVSSDPYRSGLGVKRRSDPFARQVSRFGNACVAIDAHKGVPECP